MKEEFHFYDEQVVIKSNRGICQDSEELIKSELFKKVLQKRNRGRFSVPL